MAQSYADLLRVADNNTRSATQKLEADRLKREKLNQKAEKAAPVDQAAINKILERRRQEQLRQKLAEQQLRRKANELKQEQQQKPTAPPKKQQQQQKSTTPKPPIAPAPSKPSNHTKKQTSTISYDDLMRYAALKTNNQPIPKELTYVSKSLQTDKLSKSASTPTVSSKKVLPNSKPSTPTTIVQRSVSSSVAKNMSLTKSSTQSKLGINRPKLNTTAPPSTSFKQPVRPAPSRSSTNGQRTTQMQVQQVPTNRLTNIRRPPSLPNRSAIPPSRKRPVHDTDDEDDDEDLRGFIVDDDEDENNNGFDYRKELHETLKQNFRFDKEKYQGRFLDDDDDDLRNMESSYDQIQREEYHSRQQGLQEDIDDVMREEAEKKRRRAQKKKRPKTAA